MLGIPMQYPKNILIYSSQLQSDEGGTHYCHHSYCTNKEMEAVRSSRTWNSRSDGGSLIQNHMINHSSILPVDLEFFFLLF